MPRFPRVLLITAAMTQSVATNSQKHDDFSSIARRLLPSLPNNTIGRESSGVDGSSDSHSHSHSHSDRQLSTLGQLHSFALANVLAGGSGIRATVPVFLISLMHAVSPESVPLVTSMQWLGYWYVCVGLGVLLIVEIVADLIPAVDHVLHAVLTPVTPLVGALMALAPDYYGGAYTHVPLAIWGAGLAFAAHGGKAVFRTGSTATTGGTMNCFASLGGSIALTFTIIIAVVIAIMSIVLAICVVTACVCSALFLLKKATKPFFLSSTEEAPCAQAVVTGNTHPQLQLVEPPHLGTNVV